MDSKKVILKDYWSKATAFLLPLTGLKKKANMQAFLYWNEHTIEDYKLILYFEYDNQEEFEEYCQTYLIPTLDKKGYLLESYDFEGRTVFVLDISEWSMDIEFFLAAKYSKFTHEAKNKILLYHADRHNIVDVHIMAALYPFEPMKYLDNKSPVEYLAKEYNFNLETLNEIGEIGSKLTVLNETLLTDIDQLCQSGTESIKEQ